MTLNQLSSGDLIADRRADYAKMLAEGGEPASAAELMEQALERAPDWAAGWFRLADYAEKSGRKEAAIDALRKTLALSPQDIFGAGLKLALLGAAEMPEQPPSLYVERLFDDYADRFDQALVEKLGYTVPQKLATLIKTYIEQRHIDQNYTGQSRAGSFIFEHVADLGCGTGLFGERIRDQAQFLEGFDISINMLAKAEAKSTYDRLARADLSLSPDASGIFGNFAPARADLVSAADVLMYLGNLDSVFDITLQLLAAGGHFAFSVEDAGDGVDFLLRPSLRYAHSEAYIRGLCMTYQLDLLAIERTVIRMDAGEPVFGILFLARKPA